MYSREDYLLLETKTDSELRTELKIALENYDSIQDLYSRDNDRNPFDFEKVPMNIIISKLKEVEGYIRKIENLLTNLEYDRGYVRKCINRRRLFLERHTIGGEN